MTVHTLRELAEDPALLKVPEALVENVAYRGCVSLLSGREKVGKSTYVGQLPGARRQLRWLWLAIDEWKGFVVQRLLAHEADLDGVLIEDERIEIGALGALIAEHRVDAVVIDTLREWASGVIDDSTNDMAWTPVMRAARNAARDTNCAILFLHHNTKGGDDYSGSTQIAAGVDVHVNMTREKDVTVIERRIFTVKARLPTRSFTADLIDGQYVTVEAGTPAPTKTREHLVLEFVRDHPGCSMNQVRDGVPGRKSDISKAVHELLREQWLVNAAGASGMALQLPPPTESQATFSTPPGLTSGLTSENTPDPRGTHPDSVGLANGDSVSPATMEREHPIVCEDISAAADRKAHALAS